ncbi:MAG: RnfABCDGE type electron transport complex subunit C, partial [Clostridia bacterium]|nr:RnfABCDGE type electron transport complex subunit C [Clostridia bacterium]
AECEPYITSDTRTMLDRKEGIFKGIELLQKYLAPKSIIFGIEKNKPKCLKSLADGLPEGVELKALPSVYPQGGEKVLIYHTTGKVVKEGQLPIDAGVVVINCTTLAFLGEYAKTGLPLVEKTVTVDGKAVGTPQNIIAPIGTSAEDIFAFCGGLTEQPFKVLQGGPMMGVALPDLSMPIMKGTNALLALTEAEVSPRPATACIRCGACAMHCPFKLDPRAFAEAYKKKDMEALEKGKLRLCMECGCCSFICPAARPLVTNNRLAKAELNAYLKKKEETKS